MIKKAREFQKNIYFCFIDNAKAFDCMYHNKLWKILQEMGISDHLMCLLRNLYEGQKATVRMAGIKVAGRNINNLRYADDNTLMAESKEELKSLLMKGKEESEKSWVKTHHSKSEDHGMWSHHFMTNRWGNGGNTERLYFLGLHNHCRW